MAEIADQETKSGGFVRMCKIKVQPRGCEYRRFTHVGDGCGELVHRDPSLREIKYLHCLRTKKK